MKEFLKHGNNKPVIQYNDFSCQGIEGKLVEESTAVLLVNNLRRVSAIILYALTI